MSRPDGEAPRTPQTVEQHSDELFGAARAMLGDRLAECRRDPDRGARITVIDLDDDDIATLQDTAAGLGIAEWTRIEAADPADLIAWEQLRHDLIDLRERTPQVLRSYPMPEPGYRRPPVHIHLDASGPAVAAAAELHDRYGEFLSLRVGALPYPPDPSQVQLPRPSELELAVVDPDEIILELDGPLSIRSGQTATHAVVLHNTGDRPITVNTNGNLTALIRDPVTGTTVGGFTGAQRLPLVRFTAKPGEEVRIPLLVGTASFLPDLGYSVPAGSWQVAAPLRLEDGRHLITRPMDFTITD